MLNYRNSSTALLVIDVQNDYCSPEGRVAQSGRPMQSVYRAVRNTEKLLGRARRAGIPIAFTRMVYDPKKISAGNLRRLEKIGLDG
ncbi:TPA: cysteine hydrolase family protein, partial [Candidatus Micrarchaeota archaeon]|nr:cysteine hydrolase family protein [Candidatus Micrarchaeota archaeon]